MERLGSPRPHQELKSYDLPVKLVGYHHEATRNKKWCFYTAMGTVMFLLFLYLPVYHQIQQTRIVAVHGWNYNTSRDAKEYVLPDNSTSLQRPSDFCESDLFLLVIVCSAPSNVEARDAIRDTWASETNFNGTQVKFSFLLGETYNLTLQDQLYEENRKHDDIIQERFLDTYNNLTLKSVMMLKLVNNHCIDRVRFLMKIDDDMYLNMVPLIKLLKSRLKRKRQLIGCLICGARPITDTNNKWYAPKYMYSDRTYPNYLSGTGYVMSADAVQTLYKAALVTPLFHLEDIYITGMCARAAKIKPHSQPGFTFVTLRFDPCVFKDHITSHRVPPSSLRKMFSMLKAQEEHELNKSCLQNALHGNSSASAVAAAAGDHLQLFTSGKTKYRKITLRKNNCI